MYYFKESSPLLGYSAVYLECGALKSELVTVDFGPGGDPAKEFEDKEKFQPYAPLVNSEFYTGTNQLIFKCCNIFDEREIVPQITLFLD